MGQAAGIDSGNYLDFVGITVLFLLEESSGGEIAEPLSGVPFTSVPVRFIYSFVPKLERRSCFMGRN